MKKGPSDHVQYACLDLFRGLAALTVMSGHLRAFLFVSYASAPAHGFLWTMFYLLTGLGHQAVMIFFVLSGFLIGKNISESASSGRWSLADYAIRRMSRLF